MRFETGGAFLAGLALSACAFVGPLYDGRMQNASRIACGTPTPNAQWDATAAQGVAPQQCFAFFESDDQLTQRRPWSGGAITPGRVLIAVHRAGPGCDGRLGGEGTEGGTRGTRAMFSHLTVNASSPGSGRVTLATWDHMGRPGQHRDYRWDAATDGRTFVLPDIGSVLMAPGGARITVTEGSLEPTQLCFRQY